MPYLATIPVIPDEEAIVLPISMNQPLERGEALKAILAACEEKGYQNRLTILICDYLNRHNFEGDEASKEEAALKQGAEFLEEHKTILQNFQEKLIRWKDYIEKKSNFNSHLDEIKELSKEGSEFYNRMEKTWSKCLGAMDKGRSIDYQREEYAAILCMEEFQSIIYPKKITTAMAFLLNRFAEKTPKYNSIKIKKEGKEESPSQKAIQQSPKRTSPHLTIRVALNCIETVLTSLQITENDKKLFAEIVMSLLLSHNDKELKSATSSEGQHSQSTAAFFSQPYKPKPPPLDLASNMTLEVIETVLKSHEVSPRAKIDFSEAIENLFLSHHLINHLLISNNSKPSHNEKVNFGSI